MRKAPGKTPAETATGDAALFLKSLHDPDIIERVRVTIPNAHVFKLPPRQAASSGWMGADWKEKVWQGTVKVVERGHQTAVLLVERVTGSIFAVCPVKEGAVDRCKDSSRYFVLRIENANGRHMFIGVAFNERNDAFDFNTALQDAQREREAELRPPPVFTGPTKDYSIKEGQKIHVALPKTKTGGPHDAPEEDKGRGYDGPEANKGTGGAGRRKPGKKAGGGLLAPSVRDTRASLLAPSSKDTPKTSSIVPQDVPPPVSAPPAQSPELDTFFADASFSDPIPSTTFGDDNIFKSVPDDQSTGSSHPFFKNSGDKPTFDPRQYQTGKSR